MDCNCEFEPDPDDPEDDWHYRRVCKACGKAWWSLHCPHDANQRPCAHCGHVHMAERDPDIAEAARRMAEETRKVEEDRKRRRTCTE